MRQHTWTSKCRSQLQRWSIAAPLAVFGAIFALLQMPLAQAARFPGLYEASVRAADRSDKARDAAFAEALGVVAVRVTGMRDAAGRLGGALGGARKYVQKFGYNADGTIQVGFDDTAVDQFLLQAGLPVWGQERPTTLIWLVGDSGAPNTHETIERAARARGIPVVWPAPGETMGADPGEGNLNALAARYHADAVLIGRSGESGGLRWVLGFGGAGSETQGSLEDGVGFAADSFARVFATAPSAVSEVAMDVSGIDSLSAYAGALNYIEGLTLVRSTFVERVAGDSIRFRLVVRGDASTLRRAIALDHHLLAAGSDAGALSFRYQP